MSLEDSLQSTLDDIDELIANDEYEIQGFGIVMLIKNKDTEHQGYLINYEALEFLKLISVLDIARYRIIKAADDAVNEELKEYNEQSEDDNTQLDNDLDELLDLTKIDPQSDTHH